MLADCIGKGQVMVNSTHHQAVKQVGPNASVAIFPEGGATYAPERRCRCVPN